MFIVKRCSNIKKKYEAFTAAYLSNFKQYISV